MSIYDIHGNQLIVDGGIGGEFTGKIGLADLSEELVNPVMVVDENTAIVNLLNLATVSEGRVIDGYFNKYYPAYRTSDYIQVNAGQTYVAQSWDSSGSTHSDRVELFDADKAYVQTFITSGNGTIRYCIFTPEVNGFVRYCYTYSETANPMVFIGTATTDVFVEYTGETLTGDVYYEIAQKFKGMVRRDVEPSNLYGKRVYMIGDSNSDNWSNGSAKELEKRYGCTVISLGRYGAKWAADTDATETSMNSAIGQWNAFVDAVGIDEETYTFPDDVVLLFMMGTNGGSGTFAENIADTGEDVTTPQGAINYIFKRARYYGRNISIGVFLPWCGSNNDQLKRAADYYKIPTFDISAIIADDTVSAGLVRPDGTVVSQNYITDGGNHLATWGNKIFERIAHPWIAYMQGTQSGKSIKGDKGDPYTLTETDKAAIVTEVLTTLGGVPMFGYVNDDNTIIVSGHLQSGEYVVKYEMEDGTVVDIGALTLSNDAPVVPDEPDEPERPTEVNYFNTETASLNQRIGSGGTLSAYDGMVTTDFIPWEDTMSGKAFVVSGVTQTLNTQYSYYSRTVYYDANKTKVAESNDGGELDEIIPTVYGSYTGGGFVRISLVLKNNAALTATDVAALKITLE